MADLAEYRRLEWAVARRPDHLHAIACAAVLAVTTAWVLPRMPDVIPRFFQRTLYVASWSDIALFNCYATTYVIACLIGALDLLRVWVLPREEGYLQLYLSKPVPPAGYLRARVTPILFNAALIALATQAAAGLSVWHLIGPFDRFRFLVASAIIVALVVLMICLFNCVFLFLRETYHAVVFAVIAWSAALAPASLYVYRPDLFSPTGRDFVFPANLLWYQSAVQTHAPWVILACLLLSIACLAVAWLRVRRPAF